MEKLIFMIGCGALLLITSHAYPMEDEDGNVDDNSLAELLSNFDRANHETREVGLSEREMINALLDIKRNSGCEMFTDCENDCMYALQNDPDFDIDTFNCPSTGKRDMQKKRWRWWREKVVPWWKKNKDTVWDVIDAVNPNGK